MTPKTVLAVATAGLLMATAVASAAPPAGAARHPPDITKSWHKNSTELDEHWSEEPLDPSIHTRVFQDFRAR